MLSGRRILIVDDEPGYREIISDEFSMEGAIVFTAGNGSEAAELLKTQEVDAVITDIRMPGGSGVDLLDQIKRKDARLPVVMLITGFSDLSHEDAYDKGADAIFSKPFDLELLVKAVSRALLNHEEKFKNTELQVEMNVEVSVDSDSLTDAVKYKQISFGRGGAFISNVPQDLTPGKTLRIQILSKDQTIVFEAAGICRWVRNKTDGIYAAGFGIEFTLLGLDALKSWTRQLETAPQVPFIPRRAAEGTPPNGGALL